MKKDKYSLIAFAALLMGGIAFLSQKNTPIPASNSNSTSVAGAANAATHSDATPHAANMQSFGSYHVEAIVSDTGMVELNFYAGKVSQLMPIASMTGDMMDAKIIVPGEDAIPVTMAAKPYAGEATGQSSRFVGRFNRRPDQSRVGFALALPFEGIHYRINWSPDTLVFGATSAHGDTTMPTAVTDDQAQKLFLTPGGLYTQADIDANGRTTAALKFVGMMAHHSMNPAKGDALCPVTNTVADQRFAWIIDGKKYLFCCPPCVEEFVKKAKEKPESILPPEHYVKN